MHRRALLIGAQTGGLSGVTADVATMAALLGDRGFDVIRCEGAQASRAGILDAYEKLIADTAERDAVVVTYSGHGGYALPPADLPPADLPAPEPAAPGPVPGSASGLASGSASGLGGLASTPTALQFIVPTDFDEGGESDFRGISAPELSVLLARLTDRTPNVTTIFDCCHAAHMTRDADLMPKARARPLYLDIAAHLRRLRAAGLDLDSPHVISNPHAVRLVACAPWESAYEYTSRDGIRTGLLTESFGLALTEAGDLPVTWQTLVARIRARVLTLAPTQRPAVEGARTRRLIFEEREAEVAGVLPAQPLGRSGVSLPGGRLLDVAVGDTFVLMPAGADTVVPAEQIGTATVSAVGSVAARADVEFTPPHTAVPPGAQAFPHRSAGPRRPVAVTGPAALTDPLRAKLAGAAALRPAGDDDAEVLARVEVVDGQVRLSDRAGPLLPPEPSDRFDAAGLVADLGRLARAETLRALADGAGVSALAEAFTVEWGRVSGGRPQPLRPAGEVIFDGQPIYVLLRNDSQANLFFFLFDIGVAGAVTLLTNADPAGLRLTPGQQYVVGARESGGALEGLPVSWPAPVPPGPGRPETLLVVVTSSPQELAVVVQDGVGRPPEPVSRAAELLEAGSPLERMLAQLAVGGRRDVGLRPGEPAVRYAVRHLDFLLSPSPPPAAETTGFLVDERPEATARMLAPPATAESGEVPRRLAVRLDELVVHRRPAGSAALRVDALVLTTGPDRRPAWWAGTARFEAVRDGDRLPLETVGFRGGVADHLDLAVWVSSDRRGAPMLDALLRRYLGAGRLPGEAAPTDGPVAALDAVAAVVDTASRLLSEAAGGSVGVYRAGFLPADRFGVGDHPARGLLRTRDFSLRYVVEPAG